MKLTFLRRLHPYWLVISITFCVSLIVYREEPLGFSSNRIPLAGDGLLISQYALQVLNADWSQFLLGNLNTLPMGWPFYSNFSHFPVGNLIDFLLMKLMNEVMTFAAVSSLIHTYVILRFCLTALFTFLILKNLQVSLGLNLIMTNMFTFSSYVLIRSEGHFVLGSVWSLPLAFLCINRLYREGVELKGRNRVALYFGCLTVGLNNFYYAIFILVVSFLAHSILWLIYSISQESRLQRVRIYGGLKATGLIAIGLLIQLTPILYQQSKQTVFYSLSERSGLEAYYYGGNLLSAMWPIVSIVLSQFKLDSILAFLQTQIVWEASQLGLLTALLLLILFSVFCFTTLMTFMHIRHPRNISEDNALPFLWLFISVVLYFRNPITILLTESFGSIRVWSRITPLISLMCIVVIATYVQRDDNKRTVKLLVMSLLVIASTYDIYSFRASRPPASELNSVALNLENERDAVTSYLGREFKENCGFVQLPVYPYPEFDSPRDSETDYWQLALAEPASRNDIHLSGGTFKNSWENRVWQPLFLEVDPFDRASLKVQIEYTKALGACGAIVLSSALYQPESAELREIQKQANSINESKDSLCIQEIGKYSVISYKSDCIASYSEILNYKNGGLEVIQRDIKTSEMFWRNITPNSKGFEGIFPLYDSQSIVRLEYRSKSFMKNSSTLVVVLKRTPTVMESGEIKFCVSSSENIEEICNVFLVSRQTSHFATEVPMSKRDRSWISVRLDGASGPTNVEAYGVLLFQKNNNALEFISKIDSNRNDTAQPD